MIVKIGDNEYEAVCNGLTPIAYSRCFSVVNDIGVKRPKDINEAVGAIIDAQRVYGFPPIVPLLEILYACIKTADPRFPVKFNDWVSAFPADAYDLGRSDGWASDVMDIVAENFFPNARKDVEAATD